MAADERWYFTKEQLANTPSRKYGTDADKELSYRQESANFIEEIGQGLKISQLCINTAIVYMHRFYMFHSFSKFHRYAISKCALFLAAKVEEQPHKVEHVIKAAHSCLQRGGPTLDTKTNAYLEQIDELLINENIMLQTLGFDTGIVHPHIYVVKFCELLRANKFLAQTSYFMATYSLHLTTMCLQYKPTTVACLCIHLACKWSNCEIPQSSEGKDWFWYLDKQVTNQVLEELTSEFLVLLEKCPSHLKRKIMKLKESQLDTKAKSAMGFSQLPLNLRIMDNDKDLEAYLNSKDFLDLQRDSMEMVNMHTSSQSSSAVNNSNPTSSKEKPSPPVVNQKQQGASSLKPDPDTEFLNSTHDQSPSKNRRVTLSLAAYRKRKKKRRSEAPPGGGNKDQHTHNSHWKAEACSSGKPPVSNIHHSSYATQEGSGERHKGHGHLNGFRTDEKVSEVRTHHHHHHQSGSVDATSNNLSERSPPPRPPPHQSKSRLAIAQQQPMSQLASSQATLRSKSWSREHQRRSHKKNKRSSSGNLESLMVNISLNKGVKTSNSNHIATPLGPQMPPLAMMSAGQPNLEMKIDGKYLENNGKPVAPAVSAKFSPESKDVGKVKDSGNPLPKGSDDGGNKKQERLKLVLSKERLSLGSHATKRDWQSRKGEWSCLKAHDPMRNSNEYQNKMSRMDHHSGHG